MGTGGPKKVCSMEKSRMLDVRSHAALLAHALNGIDYGDEERDADASIPYLEFCSGIESVEFSTFPFDDLAGFCEPADGYRQEHDQLR
jgi:hypothetical protein